MGVPRSFPKNHGSLRVEFSLRGPIRKIRCFRPFPFPLWFGCQAKPEKSRKAVSPARRSLP